MGALATAVARGKAFYAGISSYSPERTAEAAAILRDLGTPLLIHQPSYSLLNRWIEDGLLDALEEAGAGCITFSPLAQGLLTDKYLAGIPEGSRASQKGGSLSPEQPAHMNRLPSTSNAPICRRAPGRAASRRRCPVGKSVTMQRFMAVVSCWSLIFVRKFRR
jgi:aryl-alcohol dehydrogenase-like predicted oxidoreductase